LFTDIKKSLKELNIDLKKFDQCKEVRNLNVPHNRDNFINLTILEVLINNNIIDSQNYLKILSSDNHNLKEVLNKKIKNVYQFEFLKSNYFRNWLGDPIRILSVIIQFYNNLGAEFIEQKLRKISEPFEKYF